MPESTENLTEPDAIIRELIEAGATLEVLGHYDESIAAYTEVDTRFGSETDPEVADLVAIALIRKGQLLSRLRRREESTAVFDDVVSRYQAERGPALSHPRRDRAVPYRHRSRDAEPPSRRRCATYNLVIDRYADDDGFELRVAVARSMLNKGAELGPPESQRRGDRDLRGAREKVCRRRRGGVARIGGRRAGEQIGATRSARPS